MITYLILSYVPNVHLGNLGNQKDKYIRIKLPQGVYNSLQTGIREEHNA